MFNILKNIFSFSKKKKPILENKYFEKYRDFLKKQEVSQLIEEYKTGIIVFEPIRKTLTEPEQEKLYSQIDKSYFLSPQEKIETIIGLMMILDGSFPKDAIVDRLGKVFGKEFMNTILKKRDEFKTEITVTKAIKFLTKIR